MKKFIIIIACNLVTGITLATNDKDNLNNFPTNKDQKIHTNNIEAENNVKLDSKIQELLKPNDIIITMASNPYPRISPRVVHHHYNIPYNRNFFPSPFKYKTMGIISAVGSGITNYKVSDMVNIENLNDNSPLDNELDNLNDDQKNNFFYNPRYHKNDKVIPLDLEDQSMNARVKQDFI